MQNKPKPKTAPKPALKPADRLAPPLAPRPRPQGAPTSRPAPKPALRPAARPDPELLPDQPAPPEAVPKGKTWLYGIGFALGLGVFGVATYYALSYRPMGWEYGWFMAVNHFSDSWSWLMLAITFLGSTWAAAASVVVTFLLKMYRLAWRLALTIVGAYGVAFIAKELVNRARPEGLFDPLHVRVIEHGNGFPSGHATIVTVIALTILPYLPWKLRWVLPIVIAAVAVSRIYLGVHVPLDVVGGVALGTAAVAFIRILPMALRKWLHIN